MARCPQHVQPLGACPSRGAHEQSGLCGTADHAHTGHWMGSMSAWFKAGLAILGLVLLAFMFFKVVGGAVGKWGEYTKGRADIGDLKEYLIMGIIIVGFAILMVTYAFQVIGET
jgi:hypothetical protein